MNVEELQHSTEVRSFVLPGGTTTAYVPVVRAVVLCLAIIVAILAVVVGARLVGSFESGGSSALLYVAEWCVILGILVLTLYVFIALGPGAVSAAMSPEGFTLEFRGGRSLGFRWRDPRLRCRLYSFVSESGATDYSIATRIPFLSPVSEEFFRSIVEEATRLELRILRKEQRTAGGTQVEIRIYQRPRG